jgi:hypothetical protein
MTFILQEIKSARLIPVLDPQKWRQVVDEVFLWEALVSGNAHSTEHIRDAATAAAAFWERLSRGRLTSDVSIRPPVEVLSMVGCALLWTGYSENLGLLREPAVVIKPSEPYSGSLSYGSGSFVSSTSSASFASFASGFL